MDEYDGSIGAVVARNVEDEVKESYLRYSMSVIVARALPDVRDGLKPSQRRILYAMLKLSLGPQSKHRKCAKISGDTSGDYHPHGEQVIYPTLVRLAQDWVMRYTLIQGQGNFGSVDGDPPAQMRYTEARLTKAAVALMEDLEKETVDHIPNYDETRLEPVVFPAKFPNLLCNGSAGIAVGMATQIPPHNLKELVDATILVLDDPYVSIDEICKVMPGPDFPTGGLIVGQRGIREAFHTGRGKVILRAKLHTEPLGNDRESIIVDELPYNIVKARLIEHVADLVNDKVITGISDIRDESDKRGMRVVFELKRGEVSEIIINQLYKHTELQTTFGTIQLALDKGLPRVMNIRQMIAAWIEHRVDIVRKRTRFDLKKAEARAHILEGYLKALDHLDAIVALIRAAANRDEAKVVLMERYAFSEKQAMAVLDLRLYQLTGLERDKIVQESAELAALIADLRAILASEQRVKEIIRKELLEVAVAHPEGRKSMIVPAEGDVNIEDLIANEACVITISDDDYIRRMPLDSFREQRRGGQGVSGMMQKRDEDSIKALYVAKTHEHLLVFTSFGRCYWLKVWQLPETTRKGKGKAIVQLLGDLQEGEKIATVLCISSFEDEGAQIAMITKAGTVKKTALGAYSHPRRTGVNAISIDDGDELLFARLVHPGQQLMIFSRSGMAVRFEEDRVRAVGRTARGVRGIRLRDENDRVVGAEVISSPQESILVVCENGYGKRSLAEEFRSTNRGGLGVRSIICSERNGEVVAALSVADRDSLLLMSAQGQAIRIPVADLRVLGRSTQGVRLAKLREGDTIVAVQRLASEELSADESPPS